MGSVILMAGDKKQMTHGSRIMIHEASTIAMGDSRALRKTADLLEGISAEIAGIYSERTGGDESKIRALMLAEAWMTADEAKDNGFVDTVIKDGKVKAGFDTPGKTMSILARLTNPANDEALEKIAALENAAQAHDEAVAEFQAKLDTAETTLQAAATELGEMKAQVADYVATIESISAKLAESETLANENAQTIADLTEKATLTDEKVNLAAAAQLAALDC